jgi:predicted transposase/invertase (TIGR01784 family)
MNKQDKKINNPHDKFIKSILSDKDNAVNFLQNYLPKDLVKIIDFKTLAIENVSYIKDNLKALYSDLLFNVKIKGNSARIYILFEHKSKADEWVGLQLLKYMVEIWETEKENKKNEIKKLTPIIPFVFYHGKTDWNCNSNFGSLLRSEKEYEKYLVDFTYILQNVTKYLDKEIPGDEVIKTVVYVMKHIFEKEFMKLIYEMIDNEMLSIKSLGKKNFLKIIIYVLEQKNVDVDKTIEKLKNKKYEKEASEMLSTAERLRREGRQEGRQEAESKFKQMIKNLIKEGYDKLKIKELSGLSDRELNRLLPQN